MMPRSDLPRTITPTRSLPPQRPHLAALPVPTAAPPPACPSPVHVAPAPAAAPGASTTQQPRHPPHRNSPRRALGVCPFSVPPGPPPHCRCCRTVSSPYKGAALRVTAPSLQGLQGPAIDRPLLLLQLSGSCRHGLHFGQASCPIGGLQAAAAVAGGVRKSVRPLPQHPSYGNYCVPHVAGSRG